MRCSAGSPGGSAVLWRAVLASMCLPSAMQLCEAPCAAQAGGSRSRPRNAQGTGWPPASTAGTWMPALLRRYTARWYRYMQRNAPGGRLCPAVAIWQILCVTVATAVAHGHKRIRDRHPTLCICTSLQAPGIRCRSDAEAAAAKRPHHGPLPLAGKGASVPPVAEAAGPRRRARFNCGLNNSNIDGSK